MASLADEIAKQARRRGIGGMLEYYAGPHVSQSARNLGQALQGGLEWLSPAGDIQDLVSSSRDISRGVMSGSPTQALSGALMATAAALGMALPGPSASKIGKALPMDEASRMARAKEMGFDIDAYHGLGEPLEGGALRLGHGGKVDRGYLGEGLYFTESPRVASGYASRKAAMLPYGAEAQNVMPVKLRAKNPKIISSAQKQKLSGMGQFERQDWLYDVLDEGYDSVIVDYGKGKREIMIPDPKNVRSRFAAFDPAKKNLANILAGAGGAALLAPAIASQLPEE